VVFGGPLLGRLLDRVDVADADYAVLA